MDHYFLDMTVIRSCRAIYSLRSCVSNKLETFHTLNFLIFIQSEELVYSCTHNVDKVHNDLLPFINVVGDCYRFDRGVTST